MALLVCFATSLALPLYTIAESTAATDRPLALDELPPFINRLDATQHGELLLYNADRSDDTEQFNRPTWYRSIYRPDRLASTDARKNETREIRTQATSLDDIFEQNIELDTTPSSTTPWMIGLIEASTNPIEHHSAPNASGKKAMQKLVQHSLKNWWRNGDWLAFSANRAIELPRQFHAADNTYSSPNYTWDYKLRASKNRIKLTLAKPL